jgi:hypothetical protein
MTIPCPGNEQLTTNQHYLLSEICGGLFLAICNALVVV